VPGVTVAARRASPDRRRARGEAAVVTRRAHGDAVRTARTQFDLVTGAEARRMIPARHERVPGVATGDTYGDRLAAGRALDYERRNGVAFDRQPDGTIAIRRNPDGSIWRAGTDAPVADPVTPAGTGTRRKTGTAVQGRVRGTGTGGGR
jgi:hypothetical protein